MIERKCLYFRQVTSLVFTFMLAGLLQSAQAAFAQDKFREVKPEDLLENPKHYWSLALVFKDTLTARDSGPILHLGNKRYTTFVTKTLGICYAVEELVPKLQKLAVDHEYLFRGTVLNRQGGFFNKQEFFVVIQNIAPVFEDLDTAGEGLIQWEHPDAASGENSLIAKMLSDIHQELFVYAEQQDIAFDELFKPDSEYKPKVMDVINSTIFSLESQRQTSPLTLLGEFTHAIFMQRYSTPAEKAPAASVPADSRSLLLKTGIGKNLKETMSSEIAAPPTHAPTPIEKPTAKKAATPEKPVPYSQPVGR